MIKSSGRYNRLLSISKVNGWTITVFAGIITLLSLSSGSAAGFIVGVLVTSCGVLELIGRSKLVQFDERSALLLPLSQGLLLMTVWIYSIFQLLTISTQTVKSTVSENTLRQLIILTDSESAVFNMVAQVLHITYITVIIVTAVYQGGLGIYYWKGARTILDQRTGDQFP